MLATIVLDAYKYPEREEIANSLNRLIQENCWSTAGIYCYWDYDSKQALYLRLTVDLYKRFLQHNSLIRANSKACKSTQIKEYFQKHDRIGFSIMLQSRYSQPLTSKLRKKHWGYWQNSDANYMSLFGLDGSKNIKLMEGITIETFKMDSGVLPLWNYIGGSHEGKAIAASVHIELLKLLTNQAINDNVSRATLREINTNMYGFFECFFHGLRTLFMPLKEGIEFNRRIGNEWMVDQFLASNYLAKKLILPV